VPSVLAIVVVVLVVLVVLVVVVVVTASTFRMCRHVFIPVCTPECTPSVLHVVRRFSYGCTLVASISDSGFRV